MNKVDYNQSVITCETAPLQVSPINKLPTEILNIILSFLPLTDRNNAALVCRHWRHLSLQAGKAVLSSNCDLASKFLTQLQDKDQSLVWKNYVDERANQLALVSSKLSENLERSTLFQIFKELKRSFEIVDWREQLSQTELKKDIECDVSNTYRFTRIISNWQFYMLHWEPQLPLRQKQLKLLDALIQYPILFAERGAFDTAKKMIADLHQISDQLDDNLEFEFDNPDLVHFYNQFIYQEEDTVVTTFEFLDTLPNHVNLALLGIAHYILKLRDPGVNILKYFEGYPQSDQLVLACELSRRLLQQNCFKEAFDIILHIAIPKDRNEPTNTVGKIFNHYLFSVVTYHEVFSKIVKAIESCGGADREIQYMFYMIFDFIQEIFDDDEFDYQADVLRHLIADSKIINSFDLSYKQYSFNQNNYVENTNFDWDFDPESLMDIEP